MSSSEEAVAPTPSTTVDREAEERRRVITGQILSVAAYFLFSLLAGLIAIDPHRLPNPRVHPLAAHVIGLIAMIVPTSIGMLLQLTLIWKFIKVDRALQGELKWAAVAFPLWLFCRFGQAVPHDAAPWIGVTVSTFGNLSLTITLTMVGGLLSRIIREPKILLPICLIAGVIDFFGVMTGIGFTQHMVAQHPSVVSKVSVRLPAMHLAGGITLPTGQLGPADILFLAFFFAVVVRYRMNFRGTFVALYCILTPVMIGVTWGRLPPIPALVPMAIAVIGVNWKYFTYSREEKFAMLYAGLICVAAAIGFNWYTSRYVFDQPRPPHIRAMRNPLPRGTHS